MLFYGCYFNHHHGPNTSTTLILECDNIELSFDNRRILYAVYLKAETGKITGILGRNGCGKTSLLSILFGSLKPKYVNIRLDGIHQKHKLYQTGRVAYLPQHQLLSSTIKLHKAFDLFNVSWSYFITVFPSFNIYENIKVEALSSGELRLVETYLILNSKKKIILLDEPFSFIAPVYVEKIKKLIQMKKKESAIVITDHFYRDILEIGDSIYMLKDGYSKPIKTQRDLENEGYISVET